MTSSEVLKSCCVSHYWVWNLIQNTTSLGDNSKATLPLREALEFEPEVGHMQPWQPPSSVRLTQAPWPRELSNIPVAVNPAATLQEMVPVAKRRFSRSSTPRFLEGKVGQC